MEPVLHSGFISPKHTQEFRFGNDRPIPSFHRKANKKQLIVGKGVSFSCSAAPGSELTPNLTPNPTPLLRTSDHRPGFAHLEHLDQEYLSR
ncbi:hypothetical protein C0J45_15364 [Silurus meridionalis]|nr:hypothetical protein C0J45_15364 [Silurus meridionalis]